MNSKRANESAFVLTGSDRFHSLLVSDSVRFEMSEWETVITFFVIRRTNGKYSIVNVIKTFEGDRCVSRRVNAKEVPGNDLVKEIAGIRDTFTAGVEAGSGKKLVWHELDLSQSTDIREQVKRIQAWGRVGAIEIPVELLN